MAGVDRDDVERLAGPRDPDALALPDRDLPVPGVPAEDAPRLVDDVAGAVLRTDELGRVAAVEVLRVRLRGDLREPVLARVGAHLRLAHGAEREDDPRKLLLREPVEEVALVAGRLGRAQEADAAAGAGAVRAGVVARREGVEGEPRGAGGVRDRELEERVAEHAGIGRAALEERAAPRGDHGALVERGAVEPDVGDAESRAERLGRGGVLLFAGAEAGVARPAPVAAVPEHHRGAEHLVARLPEEERRHGAVHATAHADQDLHGAGVYHAAAASRKRIAPRGGVC